MVQPGATATVPLAESEAEVKIARPSRSESDNDGNGHDGKCCGSNEDLGAILVSDSNEQGGVMVQKPFWGGTFAYVQENANGPPTGGQWLHVVKRTAPERRFKRGKRLLVTFEESVVTGGFGSAVLEAVEDARLTDPVYRDLIVRVVGIPADRFVEHGAVDDLRRLLRLDADGLTAQVRETLGALRATPGLERSAPG